MKLSRRMQTKQTGRQEEQAPLRQRQRQADRQRPTTFNPRIASGDPY
jgi:hypothetical protein